MRRWVGVLVLLLLTLGTASAQEAQTPTDELVRFREAYTTGKGLTYVVVKDGQAETIYRYGDASREAAKRDKRGFMLFTCALPRPFVMVDPEAVRSLKTARVVKAGEPEFAELDKRYLSGCRNPFVRSAIPKQG
jgi:hypothetical protein